MSESESMRICAIMPAYNRAAYIGEALDSIAAQKRLPDDVIVVDDGSTDNTIEVVERWIAEHDLPVRLMQQKNKGAAAARNTAIRATDADLIAPLDSDDVWLPEHLGILERAFLQCPDLVVSAGNTERLDDLPIFKKTAYNEELFTRLDYETKPDGLRVVKGSAFESLLKGAYIATPSCMFRRDAAVEVGMFDETLRSFEDQLFFLRLSRRGRFGLYMDSLTLIRKHDDNLTHKRHIAQHIMCAISALEKVVDEKDELGLNDREQEALQRVLNRKVTGAADKASRYGLVPYLNVCRELFRRKHAAAILHPKPMVRAMIRPRGDQVKLQRKTAAG